MNGKITGTVKMFDEARGFGFITGPGGKEYFVHHSDLMQDGYRLLHQGEHISFDIERQPDGRTCAANVEIIPVYVGKDAGDGNKEDLRHEIQNIETYKV